MDVDAGGVELEAFNCIIEVGGGGEGGRGGSVPLLPEFTPPDKFRDGPTSAEVTIGSLGPPIDETPVAFT